MSFFPDCFPVIRGAPRLVAGAPRCSQANHRRSQSCHWRCQTCRQCTQACRRRTLTCRRRTQVLHGAPKVLSGAPRCSQTYHNHSHGTPVPVIRDPSYSEGWPECPPMVRYSPKIDTYKFTLHILSDSPGVFQRLKYTLLMKSKWNEWLPTCTFNSRWIRLHIAALHIAAGDSNSPAICSKSVQCCLFVCRDISWWTTADITFLIDINRTFFDEKDIWWCLSQDIAGILHESHANNQVILYG